MKFFLQNGKGQCNSNDYQQLLENYRPVSLLPICAKFVLQSIRIGNHENLNWKVFKREMKKKFS